MKELIFIELNPFTIRAMNIANELGFEINFFTSHLNLNFSTKNLELPTFVEKIHVVNTNDINEILSYINENNVAGIFHFAEKNLIVATQIAEHLELAHPNLDGIHRTINKEICMKYLLKKGIKQPPSQLKDHSEYFAEYLWDGSQWIILGFARKDLNTEPIKFQFPIQLPANLNEEVIKNKLTSWIDLIGLDWGIVQIAFKIEHEEPILIEINPFLGNENLIELIENSLQFNLIRYLVKASVNMENQDIKYLRPQLLNAHEITPGSHSNVG